MNQAADEPEDDPVDDLADKLADFDDSLQGEGATIQENDLDELARLKSTVLRLERHWPRSSRGAKNDPSEARQAVPPDLKIGRFEIQREIGRGGFGVVFLARDPQLDRMVALKVPRPDALIDEEKQRRFASEAALAASLDHPAIVPIYEANPTGITPYIASAYCPGPDLGRWLSDRQEPVAPQEAAQFVAKLADAVHYAHEHGVLHRDLKPGNILLEPMNADRSDLELVDYHPRLTDFGLGKFVENSLQETQSSLLIGTPLYMAPEQVARINQSSTPVTDVYALGVLLYELLTLKTPFDGGSYVEVLDKLRNVEASRPSLVNSQVTIDLDTVCEKALQKEPSDRYSSAAEFAEDLNRFVVGEPILARALGRTTRIWRWCKRKPRQAMLTVLVLLSITTGSIVANRYATESQIAKRIIQHKNHEAAWAGYVAKLSAMSNAWQDRNFGQLELLLEELEKTIGEQDFRGWEWSYLKDQVQQASLTIDGFRVAWHPRLPILAVAAGQKDKWRVEVWSANERQCQETFAIPADLRTNANDYPVAVRWSIDATRIAYATRSGRVVIFDSLSGAIVADISTESEDTWCFDLNRDGTTLAVGSLSGRIELWDIEACQRTRVIRESPREDYLKSLAFSSDGNFLAAAMWPGERATWNLETGEKSTYSRLSNRNGRIAWNPSGLHFATAELDEIAIYELNSPKPIRTMKHLSVESVCWVDENRIASGGKDHTIKLWDTRTASLVSEQQLHSGIIFEMAVSGDGRYLASASSGGSRKVRISQINHTPTSAEEFKPASGKAGERHRLAWDRDGKHIVSGNQEFHGGHEYETPLRIWDTEKGTIVQEKNAGIINSLVWRKDQLAIWATTYYRKWIELGLVSGELKTIQKYPTLGEGASKFSPDYKWLLRGEDGSVLSINVESFEKLRTIKFDGRCTSLCWDANSRNVAICGGNNILVWDSQQGVVLNSVAMKGGWGNSDIDWNSSLSLLAVSDVNGRIELRSAVTLEVVHLLKGHSGAVRDLDWNDTETRLASAGDDGTVRIWDASTGDQLLVLQHPEGLSFRGVAWSSDGSRLAGGAIDGTVFIWGSENIKPLRNTVGLSTGVIQQARESHNR